MRKYESYKNSGIDWLGEENPIPKHWSVKRVKDLGNYQSGTFIDANEMDSENPYPVFGGNGIRGYAEKYNHNGEYILIGRQGALCGNINYAGGKFWATEHTVVVYKKKEYNLTWLGELFRIMNFNQYSLSAAQPGLSVDRIKRLELPIPSIEEQSAIASYLDSKTQAIDKKVSLLEKKIGYYQELRKSLINETVTKGLDKDAELHTNGLGLATPKNWLKYRLKDLGSLYSGLSGKSGDDFNQDDNPDNKGFIPFTNIANNTYLKRDHLGTVVVNEGEKQNRVRKGDIFFLMSSEGYEDIGKSAALAEDIEETYLNSFCKGYRVNPRKTNPYFLNNLMLSDYYRQLLIVEGKGFTRINLKMEKVNDFLVYIPDTLSAQEEIVKFLDAKLDTIAKIIANIQTQITTLKELRKTLINDVVTGKIKVTHRL
jgi:type I restriction enzyme, S subunit